MSSPDLDVYTQIAKEIRTLFSGVGVNLDASDLGIELRVRGHDISAQSKRSGQRGPTFTLELRAINLEPEHVARIVRDLVAALYLYARIIEEYGTVCDERRLRCLGADEIQEQLQRMIQLLERTVNELRRVAGKLGEKKSKQEDGGEKK